MKHSSIHKLWRYLDRWPYGPRIFSYLIRFFNPYTGSLKAQVLELQPGFAKIRLRDRRAIRNHLNSIHAIALLNLGEFTSGLALIAAMDDSLRGIPVHISVDYYKKARGMLTATSYVNLPEISDEVEHTVKTEIKNQDDILVASVHATWKLDRVEKT